MIELTTGMMFLVSSMYGAGSVTADTAHTESMIDSSASSIASVILSTDRKAIEQYVRENFADTPVLAEIARCESEFRQFDKNGQVVRGRVDNADVGVMQINERYHLEIANKLGMNIHTIEGNMAYARYLYDKSGSAPWNASKPCWGKMIVAMK
jgi:hypothetical protein